MKYTSRGDIEKDEKKKHKPVVMGCGDFKFNFVKWVEQDDDYGCRYKYKTINKWSANDRTIEEGNETEMYNLL